MGETVRTFLPAASPHEAGAETIDVQALPAGAAASTAVDNTDMEAAMRALLGSIHHFSDGRVRLRHPLFRESSTFGALHTLLCEGTGIRDATFNAATGSALLTYDPGQTSRKEFLQQALPLGACLLDLIPLAVLILFFCLINQLVKGPSLTVLLCVVLYVVFIALGTYMPAIGGLLFTGYLRWHNLWIGVTLPFHSLLSRIGLLAGYGLVFGCGGFLLFERKEG